MKKKILIVLLIIVLIGLILATMYVIDRKRMKDNKSVIFSTWGYDYAPPVNAHSSNLTILENNYSKAIDNVTIELNIPDDWQYEELPRNEENDFYKFALKLYKSDNNKHTILYYYHNKFGVCGTGRTDKKMYLNNGTEADIGYYDNNKEWSDISFYSLNTNIALINYGLEASEAEEVLDFVKTIRIINNESTTKETDRKAENVKLEMYMMMGI